MSDGGYWLQDNKVHQSSLVIQQMKTENFEQIFFGDRQHGVYDQSYVTLKNDLGGVYKRVTGNGELLVDVLEEVKLDTGKAFFLHVYGPVIVYGPVCVDGVGVGGSPIFPNYYCIDNDIITEEKEIVRDEFKLEEVFDLLTKYQNNCRVLNVGKNGSLFTLLCNNNSYKYCSL